MVEHIVTALWFILPAAIANATPIFLARLPLLGQFNTPLDFGKRLSGKEIFGPNKTWRGLLGGIIVATLVFWVQKYLVASTEWAASAAGSINYAALTTWIVGPLLGFGALGGDAIESFFKRQHRIKSGSAWFPFDQLDYVIGSIVATLPFVRLELGVYVWIAILWFVIHLVASYVGWRLGLKKAPL